MQIVLGIVATLGALLAAGQLLSVLSWPLAQRLGLQEAAANADPLFTRLERNTARWDQLAMWAITVGSNMARATPFFGHEGPGAQILMIGDIPLVHAGDDARFGLLGGTFVGPNALLRFYVLHCVFIPVVASVLIAVHFWRIRKDGGISGPL